MNTTRTEDKFDAESENVRVGIDEEWELPEAPYFYSPYPNRLIQVHIPETSGGREVAGLINTHWPVTIDELEAISREELEDGYSGSFIRSVLRNNYIPEEMARLNGRGDAKDVEDVEESEEEPQKMGSLKGVDDEWHRVFRMGIRAALQNDIEESEAFVAFESGFIEGQKLRDEI